MTENSDISTGDHHVGQRKGPVARKSHSIRFSDAEWETIQAQAEAQDMMPGEYVRHAALSLGAGAAGATTAEIPPGLVRLIETTYRAAYFVSTVKHNEMLLDGRGEEVDSVIKQGRRAQAHILHGE